MIIFLLSPVTKTRCFQPHAKSDAYNIGGVPDAAEAEDYHSEQIHTMKKAGADHVTAMTFSGVEEAIGFCRAARTADIPVGYYSSLRGGRGEAIPSKTRYLT